MIIKIDGRENVVICLNSLCKKRYNINKDTIFYYSKLEKIQSLKILEMFMCKMTYKQIRYFGKVSKPALWSIFNKVADIIVPKYYDEAEIIGGENVVVQIDESKFGKRKYNVGHALDGIGFSEWLKNRKDKDKIGSG
ncbi:hypothetical protein BDAP_001581 [Binucleata daphniae]